MVRDGSVVCPGSDAAVLRIKADSLPELNGTRRKANRDVGGWQRTYVYLDPYEGGKIVMAEACRNLACSGAVPLGTTDNLNMPSPMKPNCSGKSRNPCAASPRRAGRSTHPSPAAIARSTTKAERPD